MQMRSTLTRRPRRSARFLVWLGALGVLIGLYAVSWVWLLEYTRT